MVAALAPGAPLVHADKGTNRAFTWGFSAGDYEAAKAGAEVVVSRRFVQQRVIPAAMEPRAVLAEPAPATGEFTLWTATQVPHFVRILMSTMCGIPEQKLRVIAPDVGGAFGGKLNVYAEEAIALAVARRLGRPVKWDGVAPKDFQATTHGRDMIQDVEITATRDGRVRGLKVALTADMGAYLQLLTPAVPLLGRYVYPGIYKFDAHEFFCQGVFTTKTPTDSYRGAVPPGGRLRCRADHGRAGRQAQYRPAGTAGTQLDQAPGVPVYHGRRAYLRQRQLRGGHRPRQAAVRLRRPAARAGRAAAAPRRDSARDRRVDIHRDGGPGGPPAGSVSMATPPGAGRRRPYACFLPAGSKPSSAPHRTARGMSPRSARSSPTPWEFPSDDVDILHGDTEVAPWGWTPTGSRSLILGGAAVAEAARKVVDKARVIACAPAGGQPGRPRLRRRPVLGAR